jgi:hypothetical protein
MNRRIHHSHYNDGAELRGRLRKPHGDAQSASCQTGILTSKVISNNILTAIVKRDSRIRAFRSIYISLRASNGELEQRCDQTLEVKTSPFLCHSKSPLRPGCKSVDRSNKICKNYGANHASVRAMAVSSVGEVANISSPLVTWRRSLRQPPGCPGAKFSVE